MSHSTFWSESRNIRVALSGAILVAMIVAISPHGLASNTKSAASSAKPAAPAPHPAAPAPHPNSAPTQNHAPAAPGGRPPSSNGVYQRPPSSNGVNQPPSSNGTYTHPPSTNNNGAQYPQGSQPGHPPSTNNNGARYPQGSQPGQPPSTNNGGAHYPQGSQPERSPTAVSGGNPNTVHGGNQPIGSHENVGHQPVGGNHSAASSAKGYRTVTSPDGRQTSVLGRDGHPTMTRVQQPDGMLRTTQRLPGGSRVVQTQHNVPGVGVVRSTSYSPGRGQVERPVFGHPCCVRRSYLVGQRSYAVIYRGYSYRGAVYYRPVPAYVYSPAFYGWTVNPWGAPVVYGWGWAGQPWYAAYGGVFTPYPAYASFNSWMTDYVISSNLQQAYDAGRADGENANQEPPPPITSDMKQQLSNQIEDDLRNQQQQADAAEAASQPNANVAPITSTPDDVPDALRPGHVLFRVTSPLNVTAEGQECVLSADDWVTRTGDLDQNGMVSIQVKASRSTDCHQGANTQIALNDLMVMQGDFEQQERTGMQYASTNLGKNGLPQGPDPGAAPIALGTTVADANLSKTLKQQQQDADNDETQAVAPPGGQGGTF